VFVRFGGVGLLGGVCFVLGASRAVMAGSRSRLGWGTWAGAHDDTFGSTF
jgi:hypothetical protein